jgi:hypothetical protein
MDLLNYQIPLWGLGLYLVASAAIGALEAPTPTSSQFYRWFFKFSNLLAANVTRAFSAKAGSNGAAAKLGGSDVPQDNG